jgi:hypothetical protein
VARKASQTKQVHTRNKPVTATNAEARRLITIIEKSQVPFGDSALVYNRIKSQVEAGKELSTEDYEHLVGLVKKARDWDKAVESSAQTRPEETLSG